MKQYLFSVVVLLATSTLVGINSPANARPSSYQETCNEVSVYGNFLSANCRRRNGTVEQTSIVLRGIENINGNLKITNPRKVSTYQQTCNRISVYGNVLSANCRRRDGTIKQTSIVLHGIENINGALKYTSNP